MSLRDILKNIPEKRETVVRGAVKVSNYVDYHLAYYEDTGEFAEITIDFEYADDFHITVNAENWLKYAKLRFGDDDLENTEKHLKKFFVEHTGKVDLEDDMTENDINFRVYYWY